MCVVDVFVVYVVSVSTVRETEDTFLSMHKHDGSSLRNLYLLQNELPFVQIPRLPLKMCGVDQPQKKVDSFYFPTCALQKD